MRVQVTWQMFLKVLQRALQHSISYLAPRLEACLQCGQAVSISAPASRSNNSTSTYNGSTEHSHGEKQYILNSEWLRASLCSSCLRSIPWMNRIMYPICGRSEHCEDCVRRSVTSFICNRSSVKYDAQMRNWLAAYKYRGNEQMAVLLANMLYPVYDELTKEISGALATADQLANINRRDSIWQKEFTHLKRGLAQFTKFFKPDSIFQEADVWDAVTYVPISREREVERGFNQAEQLARLVADRYDLPLINVLHRKRHSDKMSLQTRKSRISSVAHLFEANSDELDKFIQYTKQIRKSNADANYYRQNRIRLLIIDDIYTTGATANACAEALRSVENRSAAVDMEIFFLTWARS